MYTRYGSKVALLAFLMGCAAILGGFISPFVAGFFVSPDYSVMEVEEFSRKLSSLWIRQGVMLLIPGLILGVLCEISEKLDRKFPPEG
ncbi:hypothetical protein [Mangrovicoccus ximenensis]|uniref:hypothetical protein n=1 Tax=Mangrovicoccus ximenensis TaxID=1911570 RepID=UPI0011AE52B5|nr:hypothetical protein [Mangrovicoccus ximenensis]